MIVKAKLILYPMLLLNNEPIKTSHIKPEPLVPYTTKYLETQNDNSKFYNKFWDTIIKENCDKEQWKLEQQ